MSSITPLTSASSRSRRLVGAALPLVLLGLLLGLALAGCAPSAASDPVTALRLDDTNVSLSSYQQMLTLFNASAALQANGGADALGWQSPTGRQTLTSSRAQTVSFFTSLQALRGQIAAQRITVSQKDIDLAKGQLEAQISQAAAQVKQNPSNAPLKALVDAATPDAVGLLAEQQADSTALTAKGKLPTVHARGILVKTQQDATSILKALQAGGDFAALAKAHSLDAPTAAKGGDLGTVYVGQLTPSFDTQIFKNMRGNGYAIVPVNGSYGVFQILSRGSVPISGVSDSQAQQQYLNAWLSNVLIPQVRVTKYISA